MIPFQYYLLYCDKLHEIKECVKFVVGGAVELVEGPKEAEAYGLWHWSREHCVE